MNITAPQQTSTVTTEDPIARLADALGACLAPEDVHAVGDGPHRNYAAIIDVIPEEAVEAAMSVVHYEFGIPLTMSQVLKIVEAAYPATRADQLRKFADDLEDVLEFGESVHQLPYQWRADADLLEETP